MSEPKTSVSGDEAAAFKVIRTSDLADAHTGVLLAADSMAGTFSWKDSTGETKYGNLGPHSIKIVRR